MIDTPSIDWFALSPILALLATGRCAARRGARPRGLAAAFSFFVTGAGFATAFGFAAAVFADSEQPEPIVAGR